MRISFIVPVYNVEKYLEQCVESILAQDYDNYEIILVDDGSKDNSGKICDYYSKKYKQIRTIHKENGGLSSARNEGLHIANGDYVLFVDSDDYIAPNILDCLVRESNFNEIPDVLFLEAVKVYADGHCEPMKDGYNSALINGQSKDIVMKHLAGMSKFPGSACTKMVSLSLIKQNDLFFKTGLLSEDIDWTVRLLNVARRFAYIDKPYYFYRQQREGSITNTANIRNVESLLWIIEKWGKRNSAYRYQNEINAFMAYEYMIVLLMYSALNIIDRKQVQKGIKDSSWILNYSDTSKTRIVALTYKLLGLTITSKLLNWYKK